MTYKKKLIEVAIPLEAINAASALEKGNPFLKGHPRNLHQWWARRPHAAARAVIFSQLIDDPSSHPEIFKTEEDQLIERNRLFALIEKMIKWENSSDENIVIEVKNEIKKNLADFSELDEMPSFLDPFAGGGALPLEAQRLGLKSFASDLNPIAVLINKALIEIPPKYKNQPAINPEAKNQQSQMDKSWKGAQGIADDVRYYSKLIQKRAGEDLANLYQKVKITKEIANGRDDLTKYIGLELTVSSWLWARTVKSPNPAYSHINVPLVSTYILSSKTGKEIFVDPRINSDGYDFEIKYGKSTDSEKTKNGTKIGRGGNFQCIMSGAPIPVSYIREQGLAGQMGTKLMAIVAEGSVGKVYIRPDINSELIAKSAKPLWYPDQEINHNPRDIRTQLYGLKHYSDLFTSRQLVALGKFSDLIQEYRDLIEIDAISYKKGNTAINFDHADYANSITLYLAFVLDKLTDYSNSLCTWNPTNQNIGHLFSKQAIPMSWDFPESSPLSGGLSFESFAEGIAKTIELLPANVSGEAFQQDCATFSSNKINLPVISTDPPYYDNIAYADLSDFFYVWLRKTLKLYYPELFKTLVVPKIEELVATQTRHGGKEQAETFFLDGMTEAMHRLSDIANPNFPVTIYYAFKQGETSKTDGSTNTGWDTFLGAVIKAGFSISGTWPIRTERSARAVGIGTNALASSIILVCRKNLVMRPSASKRDFISALKEELPSSLKRLQNGNIAPVDLAQVAIGPGMAIYTRFESIIEADGNLLSVRQALALINQVLDETLAEQEGDFDSDTRWAITWFDQFGYLEGDYGVAEQLSKSKNTAITGLVNAGILLSKAGKVRLMKPAELDINWNPIIDKRLTIWEMVHQLIRVLEFDGERAAGILLKSLGDKSETARELCYRLYTLCERRKRAAEAMSYNGLVQSWPEITRLASEKAAVIKVGNTDMFEQE